MKKYYIIKLFAIIIINKINKNEKLHIIIINIEKIIIRNELFPKNIMKIKIINELFPIK